MKFIKILITILSFFIIGLIFYAYQNEIIIVLTPDHIIEQSQDNTSAETCSQEKIPLYYWKHNRWNKEYTTIIWSSDMNHNIQTITNNWLTLLEDEKLIDTDIQLISATITSSKELFLSFNKNIYKDQESTYAKLMIIHALLKTFHEQKLSLQKIRFLVNHQTMIDDHLNFTISWPITGYLSL